MTMPSSIRRAHPWNRRDRHGRRDTLSAWFSGWRIHRSSAALVKAPLPRRAVPPHRQTPRQERAIVAVGRSILVIVWHVLSDERAVFTDLGADHFTRHLNPETKKRNHIRQLEALGYTVTLNSTA